MKAAYKSPEALLATYQDAKGNETRGSKRVHAYKDLVTLRNYFSTAPGDHTQARNNLNRAIDTIERSSASVFEEDGREFRPSYCKTAQDKDVYNDYRHNNPGKRLLHTLQNPLRIAHNNISLLGLSALKKIGDGFDFAWEGAKAGVAALGSLIGAGFGKVWNAAGRAVQAVCHGAQAIYSSVAATTKTAAHNVNKAAGYWSWKEFRSTKGKVHSEQQNSYNLAHPLNITHTQHATLGKVPLKDRNSVDTWGKQLTAELKYKQANGEDPTLEKDGVPTADALKVYANFAVENLGASRNPDTGEVDWSNVHKLDYAPGSALYRLMMSRADKGRRTSVSSTESRERRLKHESNDPTAELIPGSAEKRALNKEALSRKRAETVVAQFKKAGQFTPAGEGPLRDRLKTLAAEARARTLDQNQKLADWATDVNALAAPQSEPVKRPGTIASLFNWSKPADGGLSTIVEGDESSTTNGHAGSNATSASSDQASTATSLPVGNNQAESSGSASLSENGLHELDRGLGDALKAFPGGEETFRAIVQNAIEKGISDNVNDLHEFHDAEDGYGSDLTGNNSVSSQDVRATAAASLADISGTENSSNALPRTTVLTPSSKQQAGVRQTLVEKLRGSTPAPAQQVKATRQIA